MGDLEAALKAAREYKPFSPDEESRITRDGKTMAKQWGELRGPVA